jgi:hypothetical protein
VLGWDGDDLQLVIALDADNEAHAAQRGVDVLTAALHGTGLGERYPSAIEVEPVEYAEHELQPA